MKKTVLVYGAIGGIIIMPMLIALIVVGIKPGHMTNSVYFGYANMLLAFTMIFFGVRSYKNKQLNGSISFWRALGVGMLIMLVASTIYVIAWVILSRLFYPGFVDDYMNASFHKLDASKLSPEKIAEKKEEMRKEMEFYRTVPGMVMYTYVEILIAGIPMALISAIVFSIKKRKQDSNVVPQ
jgi:hypothetical protein